MKFTKREVFELLKAWLAMSLAFAIVNVGIGADASSMVALGIAMLISLPIVGASFVLHELGHKYLAQKYGLYAEFKAFDHMLVLALITSFFGIIFAIPGAIFIGSHTTTERHGKIAAMGPLVNIILALISLALVLTNDGIIGLIARGSLIINAYLGLLNMIPFFGADGNQVLAWNSKAYAAMAISAAVLTFIAFAI